jgi:hypothetical protein
MLPVLGVGIIVAVGLKENLTDWERYNSKHFIILV